MLRKVRDKKARQGKTENMAISWKGIIRQPARRPAGQVQGKDWLILTPVLALAVITKGIISAKPMFSSFTKMYSPAFLAPQLSGI